MSELFLIEEKDNDDELKNSTVIIQFWDMLEDKTLEITGNLDETSISDNVLKASKWRPAGTITVYDDIVNGNIPLVGALVRARRWFTTHKGYTNSKGYFSCDGHFRRPANYNIKWERNYWDIRSGT